MIHPSSDVQSTRIGTNTFIWQYVVVLPGAVIGSDCNINAHCFIENDVVIGNSVTIKSGVYLWDGIEIEDKVQIGPCVSFTNDLYPRAKHQYKLERIKIKEGASIGANTTILGGITIGKYSLIGAGSVLTKNVPDNTLWIGNPARMVGFICNCGHKLDKNLSCSFCGEEYKLNGDSIVK